MSFQFTFKPLRSNYTFSFPDNSLAASSSTTEVRYPMISSSSTSSEHWSVPYPEGEDFSSIKLNDEGYLVVSGILTDEQVAKTRDSIREDIFNYTFIRRGCQVDPHDDNNLSLLVDMKERERRFGEAAKDTVWTQGNTRKPRVSKSTGQTNVNFNVDKLRNIDFNHKIYRLSSTLYGTHHLAYRTGAERVGMKVKGTTDMPRHMDKNPWNEEEVNYPIRIQSLVCLSIDPYMDPRDSGSICLLANFHHYGDMAAALFHPVTGLVPMKNNKSRFFTLPTDWDKKYEPALHQHIEGYTRYLHHGGNPADPTIAQAYASWKTNGIVVPEQVKRVYWKSIPMRPGDIIFWTQDLPHRNNRNKSTIPRTVAYSNLFPIDENWYGTEEHKWVIHQFRTCQFHYGVDNGNYPYKIDNVDEHDYLEETGQIETRAAISRETEIARLLTGQQQYQF